MARKLPPAPPAKPRPAPAPPRSLQPAYKPGPNASPSKPGSDTPNRGQAPTPTYGAHTLTQAQLYKLAVQAGATASEATTLAAIGMAESGGSPTARSFDGGHGRGLWQIDDRYHPIPGNIEDPLANARIAVGIMRDAKKAGHDPFAPWAAYTNGSYQKFTANTAAPAAAAAAGRAAPAAVGAAATGSGSLKSILDLGMSFIGTPYKYGGAQPGGFDCSGLLQYIFAQNGITIPRVSQDQGKAGVGVAPKDAQAGDLLAFDNNPSQAGYDHIGIYLGNGLMLQSPHTGSAVQVTHVDLTHVSAIRRIPQANTSGLAKQGNAFVYPAQAGQGATPPTTISSATGGGDAGTQGVNTSDLLGPDGKVNYAAAIGQYGYIAELARTDPSLNKVLTDAITNGWSVDRFTAEAQATPWWRSHTDSQKKAADLKATDPAEYRKQRQAIMDAINIASRQYGAKEGTQRVAVLAERFMSMGLSPNDPTIQRLVAADVKIAPTTNGKQVGTNTGQTAITVDSLRAQAQAYRVPLDDKTLQQWTAGILKGDIPAASFKSFLTTQAQRLHPEIPASAFARGLTVDDFVNQTSSATEKMQAEAKSYMVPISDAAMKKWTAQIVAGDVTPESFDSYLKEQAKSLFPTLGAAIDRGVTVAQYTDPYRQLASQTLEINPEDVDFSQPQYNKALLNVDPKTGQRAAMSLSDYQTYLRTLPQYRKTHQATQSAAEFTNQLLDTFGKVSN